MSKAGQIKHTTKGKGKNLYFVHLNVKRAVVTPQHTIGGGKKMVNLTGPGPITNVFVCRLVSPSQFFV